MSSVDHTRARTGVVAKWASLWWRSPQSLQIGSAILVFWIVVAVLGAFWDAIRLRAARRRPAARRHELGASLRHRSTGPRRPFRACSTAPISSFYWRCRVPSSVWSSVPRLVLSRLISVVGSMKSYSALSRPSFQFRFSSWPCLPSPRRVPNCRASLSLSSLWSLLFTHHVSRAWRGRRRSTSSLEILSPWQS